MRAAIVGANGQVGRALCARLPDATPIGRDDLDIGNRQSVESADFSGFDVLINAAAYTRVDEAESAEGRIAAWRVNASGVAHLARAADRLGVPLVHFSSEYVFDGWCTEPLDENASLCPISAYGASKAAGDVAAGLLDRHYILRTTWVIGDGHNFIRTMVGLARRGVSPTVVSDQIGRLTFADDLAEAVVHLVRERLPCGLYNVTNTGAPASWSAVARGVFELVGSPGSQVRNTTTERYLADRPLAAARPLNSVLDLTKADAAGVRLPDWRHRLNDYVMWPASDRRGGLLI